MNKIVIIFSIIFLVFFLTENCSRDLNSLDEQYFGDNIKRLEIPEREIGYDYFGTTIIKTVDSLNHFIQDVENQRYWNNKEEFLKALHDSIIEIENKTIVLFRITEGSGSIIVKNKGIFLDNNIPVVKITRHVPSILTADMAFYCYAYKVCKKYSKIIFEVQGKGSQSIDLD